MWLIPIIFIVLLISGTAFAYLMGAVSVLTFVAVDKTQFLSILPQRIFAQLDVFAFMAMPLVHSHCRNHEPSGGDAQPDRFCDVHRGSASRWVGACEYPDKRVLCWHLGLCPLPTALPCPRTFVPEMKERGYDPYYAGAITAASSMIGPIIPPSIIMIIYGGLTGASVAALFIAGVIPGLMLAAALMILNSVIAHIKGHPRRRL